MAAEPRVVELDHPAVRAKLSQIRDHTTDVPTFRRLVAEIALLLTYEATRSLPSEPIDVQTPLETVPGTRIPWDRVAVVPVLRAGLGMLDGALDLLPGAAVGF